MPVTPHDNYICYFYIPLRLFKHPAFNLHIRRRDASRGTRLRLLPVHDTPEVDSGEQEALTLKLCKNGLHYRRFTWSQNVLLALTGEQVAGDMTCPRTGLYHQSQRRP